MAIQRYTQHLVVDTFANLPTAALSGDFAYAQDTGMFYMYTGTAWKLATGSLPSLYTQTASAVSTTPTVAATAYSALSGASGNGSLTIPANYLTAGKVLWLHVDGTYQTPATPGNVTVNAKLGTSSLATASIAGSVLSANSTVNRVFGDLFITCRSTGTSGTVVIGGAVEFGISLVVGTLSVPLYAVADLDNNGTTATVNTNVANLLDITESWSSAAAQGTTITTCTLLPMN